MRRDKEGLSPAAKLANAVNELLSAAGNASFRLDR
jgi:hypothetical protein